MTSSVIITVVVVLGIVIAGGFLIYFMGDLFMSLAHKGKDEEAIRISQEKRTRALESRVNALENSDRAKNDPAIATVLYNGAVVEDYNPENVPAEEETQEAVEEEPVEEEEEPVAQEDDTSDYIKQRRQELMDRLMKMRQMEEVEETPEEEPVDVSDEQVEESEEQTEEVEAQPQESEETQESEEETEEAPETTEETEEQESEEQTEETTENTEEETEEQSQEETQEETQDDTVDTTAAIIADSNVEEARAGEVSLANVMSLEELEAKLAEEQERLKANEKELRQNKKEFIPLRRVKKTLESDEKKLRRKEALVAKQKVVLYGVNNYADIDEEKAKKLSEDLDLLDGLKLSVQHCEEVMSKNAERYPLLEKIFNLLSSQNAEIKENIKNLQEAIEKIKNESNGEGDAE